MGHDAEPTVQKTEWTEALLQDLYTALRRKRDDATVRGFARELMDDKDLPLSYLVRKVAEKVGDEEAKRLDVLVRGKVAAERSPTDTGARKGGLMGFVRGLLR